MRTWPGAGPQKRGKGAPTVGFHNLNLRIFNLRVSNPNKIIVDVFVDTMSDFNVPGSRPKKHDETSEIDVLRLFIATPAESTTTPGSRPIGLISNWVLF